jgi:hypothetical protein
MAKLRKTKNAQEPGITEPQKRSFFTHVLIIHATMGSRPDLLPYGGNRDLAVPFLYHDIRGSRSSRR